MALEKKSATKCYGGSVEVYSHESTETKTKMNFGIYLPEKSTKEKCPVVYFLSGLTCTEQNALTKSGAQRYASELGLILVFPDTSPRGCNIAGEDESWDFGSGAGFYVDATAENWKNNYRMYSYVTKELPTLIKSNFQANEKASITGHSMGGHGAIICALKNPGMYCSVSAFAPICNPINCPWGVKAFSGYLGDNRDDWKAHDSSELAKIYKGPKISILADQGTADGFLSKEPDQLQPAALEVACEENDNIECTMRMQEGYDHSYYFISTFMEDHLKFHANALYK